MMELDRNRQGVMDRCPKTGIPLLLLLLLLTPPCLAIPQALAEHHDEQQRTKHRVGAAHSANEHMNKRPFMELVTSFESPERMAWQRPDVLLDQLGDLHGKTVADIGSGTGFLAFRMAARGAQVLCIDVDERFLAYILGKRDALGLAGQIEPRLSPFERPLLDTAEADLVITVNTYHHIEDRVAYFRVVRDALVPGGRLVVVDFKEGEQPFGPPAAIKIAAGQIEAELREAGFTGFSLDRDTLPYQFVLTAQR